MTYTLKLFNTWQITLPKKWRENFSTKNFIAEETEEGLLIKPILPEKKSKTYYYDNKEWFGIYNEDWIDTDDLISKIKELQNG